jgi:ubiquinone/menaquinone biosynthesis C-methylase UbiE
MDKIDYERWKSAQEYEYKDWAKNQELVINEFKEGSEKYDALMKVWATKLSLSKTSKILDVGCNLTLLSRLFGTGELFGIDPLFDKLDRSNLYANFSKNNFFAGMAENMSMFESDAFDVVFCRNVIDHCMDTNQVLIECKRVLNVEGTIFLAVYVYSPLIYWLRRITEITGFFVNIMHPHSYTVATFKNQFITFFEIQEIIEIYSGTSPWDFGKYHSHESEVEVKNRFSVKNSLINLALFINRYVLFSNYFVKEILIVGKQKK